MAATEELGLEVFVEGWRRFEQILDRLDKDVDKTGKSMESTGSIAGGAFAVALGTIAVNAAMALGRALIGAGKAVFEFGKESLTMAADFQSQMAILEIAASSTGLSFDQLHDAALQVGGDTSLMGVSATGAADAMTGLFKAGLSNVEVFGDLQGFMDGTAELGGALRASIDLAAASELDMVQASDLAAVALSSFGGELETETERAEFINDAMNNMVQAADASVAEVSDLAQALALVGPTAGAAQISIQDTNNALAILSTRGIAGSRAGTSLDSMLRSLRDTTPQAADELKRLGIDIFDLATGEMLPMVDIIGQFERELGTATDAERAMALGTIFTAQGQRAMNTLLSEGVEGWEGMATATENAAGIQEQAAARSQTFNAQMEALEGTVETLKIGIGEQFLPIAQELVLWFAEMVDQHGPQLQAVFEGVAAVVAEAVRIFIWLLGTKDPLEELFMMLPGPIQDFVAFMRDEFLPAMQEVWAFVLEQVGVVVAWWQENIPLLSEEGSKMLQAWENIKESLDNIWAIIKEIVGTALSTILNIITLSMQIAQGDWEGAWGTILNITEDLTAATESIVAEFVEAVANVMGTTTEEINATWQSNWELLPVVVATVLNDAATAVTDAMEIIKFTIVDTLNDAATSARQLIAIFRQVGEDLIRGMIAGILSMVGELIRAASQTVSDAIAAAKAVLGERSPSKVFFEIGENVGQGFIDGILAKADDVSAAVSSMFDVAGTFGSLGSGAASRLKKLQLDPLTKQIKEWEKELEKTQIELEMFSEEDIALGQRKQVTDALTKEARLKSDIADAEKEQVKLNEQLLALEKQRQQLAFLKQQADLLDTIKEHGLDAKEILGGLELGIDASLEGIIQAMTRAMQAIVSQVEDELEIASPSEVFARIGRQTMQGMARGIAQLAPAVQAQIQAVVQAPSLPSFGRGGDTNTSSVQNFNLTTQSTTRAGGLAAEFGAMQFLGAGASR